jgi:hypothetical protein
LINFSHPSFPNSFEEPFILTSPITPNYNCIAWAFGDDTKWYWPENTYFWPSKIRRKPDIQSFIELYELIGYLVCLDDSLQEGIEKIVIFTDQNNVPTHAARQLKNGNWTSKLGESHDVEHTIKSMHNSFYGNPKVYMSRPINKWSLLYAKHLIIKFFKFRIRLLKRYFD